MKKLRLGLFFKVAGIGLGLLLVLGLAAPYISANQYGERLRRSLERALGRRVEFRGKVRFSLFEAGFTVEDVLIHEDPSIGLEPIAHMDSISVRPALWPLLGGRFVIASIRLDGAVVNLAKTGPAAEWGRWNFASIVNRSVMRATPALHVRNGRINFKFGDQKTVFYLLDTDLDISPPSSPGRGWLLDCSAKAARTDRAAQGLAAFTLRGRWYVEPERVDLNLELDRAGLEEITALFQGQTGEIHGSISSRVHLAGPINQIGILGRLRIEDVYRWDLLPTGGQSWPLDIRGRLDLVSQRIELDSASAANVALPLWVRFRATDYLSQPHWAVALNWNRFPLAPLMQLAGQMGAHFRPASSWAAGSMAPSATPGREACRARSPSTTLRWPFPNRRPCASSKPRWCSTTATPGWRRRWCAPATPTRRSCRPITPWTRTRSISRSPPRP